MGPRPSAISETVTIGSRDQYLRPARLSGETGGDLLRAGWTQMTFEDPRLVLITIWTIRPGEITTTSVTSADATGAREIIDLGCGTGMLTVTLAGSGRGVVGIDPSRSMLAHARGRPGGDTIEWRLGAPELIEPASADLVIMSGNVAMHILGDAWHQTLGDIARGLHHGGWLVFESRNPVAEAWRIWNGGTPSRDTPAGRLRESMTTELPDCEGIVTMHCVNEFLDDGDTVTVIQQLQFRSLAQITADLGAAGMTARKVLGDWSGASFCGTPDDALMIFEASPT